MIGLATAPDMRLTAYVFERVFGTAAAAVKRAPAVLHLLDGLAVALPWGAVVAGGRTEDGTVDLYSMNHHTDRFTASPNGRALSPADAPHWAAEPVTALNAHSSPVPGTRLVVNRELPAEMGLFTGTETVRATTLVLEKLHGPSATGGTAPCARRSHALLTTPDGVEHLPCDLAAAGLRLLIADIATRPVLAPVPAPERLVRRAAAALREGRPADLGPLLTEAHTFGDPTPDLSLRTAVDAGALGGRAIGACIVAVAPMAAVPRIRGRVTAVLTPHLGRPPRYLTALPAAGTSH